MPASSARELAAENEEMAIRLRELKTSLRKRKEARGSGVIWRSGGRGSGLRTHANDVLDKRGGRNVRPGSNNRPSAQPTSATTGSTAPRPRPPRGPPRTGSGSKRVPQPPTSAAQVLPGPAAPSPVTTSGGMGTGIGTDTGGDDADTFDEAASHASFLEALNEWRLGGRTSGSDASVSATTTSTSASLTTTTTTTTATTGGLKVGMGSGSRAWAPAQADPVGGTLLEGEYDEAAAAASFQDAVAAWRTGTPQTGSSSRHPAAARPMTASACGAQTESPTGRPIEINFSSKRLSFVEKMMLKKARAGSAPPGERAARARAMNQSRGSARGTTPEQDTLSDAEEEDDGQEDGHDGYGSVTPSDVSIMEVGTGRGDCVEDDEGMSSPYAVEEPDDDDEPSDAEEEDALGNAANDGNGDGDADDSEMDGRRAIVITPEWSPSEAKSKTLSGATTTTQRAAGMTSVTPLSVRAESRDLLRIVTNETPDIHGRHVITPSLMHDFEEMERSFTEE
eukprot:m.21008 g.21008  ORF g.21008 m.21008 type:complete len:508 (+) comp3847_c0_seq1:109-1632(+)